MKKRGDSRVKSFALDDGGITLCIITLNHLRDLQGAAAHSFFLSLSGDIILRNFDS